MKSNKLLKLTVDLAMTVLMLLLMARQITGESAHEWLGAGMFLLWIAHHALNCKWHGHLFKGKYNSFRITQLVTNILLFISMVGAMVSAVVLSREVFAFFNVDGNLELARLVHIACTFWCFVLTAVHLGLHWSMILGAIGKRKENGGSALKVPVNVLRAVGAAVAIYGLYAFIKNQFHVYMFFKASFVFYDYERPGILFFTEYLAIMGLFVFLAHYGKKDCRGTRGIFNPRKNFRKILPNC